MRLKLKMMLSMNVSPKKLAMSAALGALVGISPYIGLQTYIGLVLSTYLNLPIYPIMIGVYVTNPITIPFIFALTTKFGLIILGMDDAFDFDWHNVTISSLWEAGKTLFIPFIVGTHVAGIISAIATYFIVLYIAKKYKVYKGKDKDGNDRYGIR